MILDKNAFWPRIARIYESWQDGGKEWGYSDSVTSVDCLAVLCGKFDETTPFIRSTTTQYFLFGMPVTDIAIILTKQRVVHIICSATIAKSINTLGTASEDGNYTLQITEKVKNDPEQDASALVNIVKSSGEGKVVGTLVKEKPNSTYCQRLSKVLTESDFTLVEITQGLSSVGLIKDTLAINSIQSAAQLSSLSMSLFGLGKTLNLIEKNKQITHASWSTQCESVLRDPQKLNLANLDPAEIEVPFPPSIQSGSRLTLDLDHQADDNVLKYDNVIISLSSSYKSLCSVIARTILFNPTPEQREDFKTMVSLHAAVVSKMKPGNKLKDARLAAEEYLRENKPEWSEHFIQSIGSGIGFEFREKALQLSSTNQNDFTPGMTFNLSLGVHDISKGNNATYSMLLADTVLITEEGNIVLTATEAPLLGSTWLVDVAAPAAPLSAAEQRRLRQKEAAEKLRLEAEKQELLRQKQQDIMRKRAEERIRLLTTNPDDASNQNQRIPESYPSIKAIPQQAQPTKLFIDVANDTILVPVNGTLMPIHLSHIRSLHKTQSDELYTIQIRLNTLDRLGKPPASAGNEATPSNVFLNELTYRSKSPELFSLYQSIEQARKDYLQKIKQQQMKSSIVEQEKLEIVNKSTVRLLEVSCFPNISKARKALGRLTAHANGLRFMIDDATRSHIDIINSNIKCCFFQRADSLTNRVVIHFELVHPILIDKNRKTNFLQFYREIGEESHDVGNNSFEDDEYEMQQEELERQKRKDTNNRFKEFCRLLEDHWKDRNVPVEFNIPSYKLKFTGTVGKSGSVDLFPTSGNCLVSLDDKPPFVAQLADIDYVAFERITDRNRNFDLVLIHKDLKTVYNIVAISKEYYRSLQDWLLEVEMPFGIFDSNLLWKNILEDIHTDGVAEFYSRGGWVNFSLDEEAEEDEDEDQSDVESEYDESGEEEESGSGSSDDFTSDESSEDDSDEYSSDDDDDDDDDGDVADWDELEKKALQEDKQKVMEEKRKHALSGGPKKRPRGH